MGAVDAGRLLGGDWTLLLLRAVVSGVVRRITFIVVE